MSSIPSFSSKAKIAKALLYTQYNDITFYVEDNSMEHVYLELFIKLFDGKFKIERVFPLGGKRNVLKAWEEYKKHELGPLNKDCFFIIDRDLDPYLGISQIEDENLIYLDQYCIENYFIKEDLVVEALKWKLKKVSEEVKDILNLKNWCTETVNAFFDLFVGFLMCRKYKLGESVQKSPFIFIENKGYKVDGSEVEKYLQEIKNKYCQLNLGDEKTFESEYEKLHSEIRRSTTYLHKEFISGKYLLASLERYCTMIAGGKKIDSDLFFGLLVKYFPIEELSFLKDKVLQTKGA